MCDHVAGQQRGWDHPREYGENHMPCVYHASTRGSSPRIRGKFALIWGWRVIVGIIPANTGKIPPSHGCGTVARDHPREYGENNLIRTVEVDGEGSSPRIRGKCADMTKPRPMVGIIPANTGKMVGECVRRAHCGDHPREYGENRLRTSNVRMIQGSSPRIRGKYHGPGRTGR